MNPLGKEGLVLVLEFLQGGSFFNNAHAITSLRVTKQILLSYKELQLQFQMKVSEMPAFSQKYPFIWSGFDVTFATFFPGSTVTSFAEKAKMITDKLAQNLDQLCESAVGYPLLKERLDFLQSLAPFSQHLAESFSALAQDENMGLVHGDLKLDNIFMYNNDNDNKMVGEVKVIDWQGPTLGKPMVDVVYFAMQSVDASIQDQIPGVILDLFHDTFKGGREQCEKIFKASLWMHLCLYSLFAASEMYKSVEGTSAMKVQLGSYVDCFIRGAHNTTAQLIKYYKK